MTEADEWTPVLALPNLDIRGKLECQYAAIVPPDDSRIERLRRDHPRLTEFMSKFKGQFDEPIWPSFLLLKADAPKSYYIAEAVNGLRDVLSMSVVPYARARRLYYNRPNGLAYSTPFQFYPWMIDKSYDGIIMTNPAELSVHVVEEFSGQSFPEQRQQTIMEQDIDLVLANAMLNRWSPRFADGEAEWRDKALFRSLNMANDAARIPASTAATFYDVGRSLALWVSAYEILAHPGGRAESNFQTVSAVLEKVKWREPGLSAASHTIPGKTPKKVMLATWICKQLYDLRNTFLHGNDIDPEKQLKLNGKVIIDFAPCIYRLLLTGFLDLHWDEPTPDISETEAAASFINGRSRFEKYQRMCERALLTAVPA
jgi:hypothetical protein